MIQLVALGLVGCVLIFAVWLDEELRGGTLRYYTTNSERYRDR